MGYPQGLTQLPLLPVEKSPPRADLAFLCKGNPGGCRRSEMASELGPDHQKLVCISWDSSLKGQLGGGDGGI